MNYINITDVCDIQIGRTPKRSENKYWGQGNTWVSIADMNNKYIAESKEEVNDLAVKEYNMKIIPKNTVIMSFKLSIGKVAITKKELFTNEAIAAFMIKDDKILLTEYLYYVLKSYNFDHLVDRAAKGKTLNKRKLEQIEIPITSIEKQQQIINVLNKAENILKKRQQQIEALSNLKQSIFLDMFGDPFINPYDWKVTTLNELADIIMGQSPPGTSYNTERKGKPLLNGPTEFSDLYPIEKQWTTDPKRLSSEDDILLCVRGATAGRLNLSDKEYAIGRGLAAIRSNKKEDANFIFLILDYMYDYFQKTSDGSTFININKKTLENIPVFIVPEKIKQKYNNISNQIELNLKTMKDSLIKLEGMYDSLLHKAFNGELFKEELKV